LDTVLPLSVKVAPWSAASVPLPRLKDLVVEVVAE